MADSHPVQVGTTPCTSPHHVLPLLLLPLWVLTLSSALLSQPCPSISLCTCLVPPCTIQLVFPCHEFPLCFSFHPLYRQISSLSPHPFSSPHVNMGLAFLAHKCYTPFFSPNTSSSKVISTEPEHIIQQSMLVLAAFQHIKY